MGVRRSSGFWVESLPEPNNDTYFFGLLVVISLHDPDSSCFYGIGSEQ